MDKAVKDRTKHIIRHLPHPDVASPLDVRYICEQCRMGILEYLYDEFGVKAGELLDKLRGVADESEYSTPPPPVIDEGVAGMLDLAKSLNYANSTLFFVSNRLGTLDIIQKGMCRYCKKDLVQTVDSRGRLVLKCVSRKRSGCRKYQWVIQTVSQESRGP